MDKKILEYVIVVGRTVLEIHDEVNKRIKEGFQPLGGVAIGKLSLEDNSGHLSENHANLYQAMVRYEE